MLCNASRLTAVVFALFAATPLFAVSIDSAQRDISRLRYDDAATKLVDIAKSSRGVEKQQALYLLAGLKRSVSEAEIIYQEVIRIDPGSSWADASHIELAKIQYALGNYDRALGILRRSEACDNSQEACFFQGLAAQMTEQYPLARQSFERVRRGELRVWAYLALAEIDMLTDDDEEACRRYRSMARASVSPTAMYRYGECLEKTGDVNGAMSMFAGVIEDFDATPEALLAAKKLDLLSRPPSERDIKTTPEEPKPDVPLTGYTLQFGAFHDRTNAIKLAAELKRDLPGVRIDSDLLANKEVHRVRYGQYATRAEAEAAGVQVAARVSEPYTIMPLP